MIFDEISRLFRTVKSSGIQSKLQNEQKTPPTQGIFICVVKENSQMLTCKIWDMTENVIGTSPLPFILERKVLPQFWDRQDTVV